jgi:D-beta-D-heptose 7-phosphate kinase/D-beta-D-heptose 1-phosphate adenosyltransferase
MDPTKHWIALSGGFDPIHVGHARMIGSAAAFGHVMIILNSDQWLQRKKGYVFMPFDERKEVLLALQGVDHVESVEDADGTVCEALRRLQPTMFGNGGDRNPANTPEQQVCEELGIELMWNLGRGGKIQSSSELVQRRRK